MGKTNEVVIAFFPNPKIAAHATPIYNYSCEKKGQNNNILLIKF